MDDLLGLALPAWSTGEAVGLATIVGTYGSAPRPVGASVLVLPDGSAHGSVSGGCVEGDVYELVQEVMSTGVATLKRYGYSDADAFAVGLTCGGELEVFVQRVDQHSFPELDGVLRDIKHQRPVAVATIVEHPDDRLRGRRLVIRHGQEPASAPAAVDAQVDDAIRADASVLLSSGEDAVLTYGSSGESPGHDVRVLVNTWTSQARMIIFGAIDFASAVCRLGSYLGYEVTVCDARPVFTTRARFPDAHKVVVDWPHRYLATEHEAGQIDERTVLVVLTHDAKFDVPVLELALNLDIAYVGAMGSRRTHDDRLARLEQIGIPHDRLATLHSPVGLDLGARTPEETAVSIVAEIIARKRGGTGGSLTQSYGAIHHKQAQHPIQRR